MTGLVLLFLASAEPNSVSFTYTVPSGVERCPDEVWIRHAVAARLGFDPFRADADRRIDVAVSRPEKGLAAEIQVFDREGKRVGRREFTSVAGDCPELASAVELAMTLVVDPHYLTRPAVPEPAPAPAPAPAPPPAPVPIAPPPPPPSALPELHLQAGIFGSLGVSPQVAPGAMLGARVQWKHFSLGVEARADLASTARFGSGTVTSAVLLGSVVPCATLGGFSACALISAGALQVTGEFGGASLRSSSPLVLIGARARYDFTFWQRLALAPFLDVQAVATRTTVLSGAVPVWVTSPVTGALGLCLSVRFF